MHTKVPGAEPPIRGVMLLHDLSTGELLAVLDSGWLTAQRTALCAAFVHDRFVDSADPVAIIGADTQGRAVAHALADRRRRTFVVADSNPAAAQDVADSLAARDCAVQIVGDARDALTVTRSAITATWGAAPVAPTATFTSVQHVTMLGVDEAGKQELPSDVLDGASVFADDPTLADPVLNRPSTAVRTVLNHGPIPAGRTVYAPVGLPLQDVVAAWHVYQRATESNRGTRTALLD